MTKKKWFLILISLILVSFLASSVSADNFLDTIFRPFGDLDIEKTYDNYSGFIDFILYLILFIGIANVALGKRFESRGGKAAVVVIGIMLAIALSATERMIGFNLKSFGPLAALIIVFLIAIAVYRLIKVSTSTKDNVGPGAAAFVITYFVIRSINPNVFQWLETNEYGDGVHGMLIIALILAIWKGTTAIWPKGAPRDDNGEIFTERAARKAGRIGESFKKGRKEKGMEDETEKEVKQETEKEEQLTAIGVEEAKKEGETLVAMQNIAKKDIKDSQEIISDLEQLQSIIRGRGNDPSDRETIIQEINRIVKNTKVIAETIPAMETLTQRLIALEDKELTALKSEIPIASHISSQLKKSRGKGLSRDEQNKVYIYIKKIKQDVLQQKQDIKNFIEKGIERLRDYESGFDQWLKKLISDLKRGDIGGADNAIIQLIKLENILINALEGLKDVEQRIEGLVEHELKDYQGVGMAEEILERALKR